MAVCPQSQHGPRRLGVLSRQIVPSPVAAKAVHALSGGATVCITGAAGYVGSWLTKLCLERGYSVRACVRNLEDDSKVSFLKAMPEYGRKLTLHSADMTIPGSYDAIFEGCTTVFHPAEVFMSFSPGRSVKQAAANLLGSSGKKLSGSSLHDAATATSRNIVDSINKSSTVTRLIYTSSIAAMSGGGRAWFDNPVYDETREPENLPLESYGVTKRLTEKFYDYASAASGGKWSVIIGNPSDVTGPIQAPHQAVETWQGKIAKILQDIPSPQEAGGRPWWLVDVRDVALAEILLAESKNVSSGSRFLLTSGDCIPAEDLGARAMEMYPDWKCATTVAPSVGAKSVVSSTPMFMRVHWRNDRVRQATGINFRKFEDTFKATIDSLVSVGGIQPKLKRI